MSTTSQTDAENNYRDPLDMFADREEFLATFQQALRSSQRGRLHVLGVKGNSGTGKTFLISYLINRICPCAGYLGHPFRKLAICISLIFLCYHFPLVNDRENCGMANGFLVCLEYAGRYLANQANTPRVCLVRKVSTSAVKRKHRIRLAPSRHPVELIHG